MPLSDRELGNVIGFYMGLRKAVFIAGVTVMVAAVVAVIALTYKMGRKDGVQAAGNPPSGQAQTTPERVRTEAPADAEPDADDAEEPAPDDVQGKPETDTSAEAAPQSDVGGPVLTTRPDPLPPQSPDAAAGSPAPVPAVDGKQAFADSLDADGKPRFKVTVRPKKHAWPRRFFGAIGRGVGKALGVR